MNITTQLKHLDGDEYSFLEQYLTFLGIKNVSKYLKPTKQYFEKPSKYDNIDFACQLLRYYLNQKQNIYIIRDSDTDGDCSAAILYNFLKQWTTPIVLYHMGKQHGLEEWMLNEIQDNSLILIPDASANDKKIMQLLQEKSCKCIETDHHLTNHLDDNIITVNNQRSDKIKNKFLSGAGVTDKFVRRYCELYDVEYPHYEDLVAISLVSDVCNLTSMENRTYMYFGLHNIVNSFLTFLFEKCCKRRGYTPEAIGWDISPLANALARSDEQESKTLFFDGLVDNISPEEALKQMRKVKRLQDEKTKSVVGEIEPNLNLSKKVIVGFTSPDNANLTGLIANKFTGKYNKPTILLRDTGFNSWSGSLRSPVPLATIINDKGIASAQGHEEACGILVKKNKFEEFTDWLETLDLSNHSYIEVTAAIKPRDITLNLCDEITKWKELWGHGIEEPQFYIKTKINQDNIFVFEKNSTTLKLVIDGVSFIKFFATPEDIEAFKASQKFEIELVVGELSVNEWEGAKTPQCFIKQYEIHSLNNIEDWEDSF